MKAIDMAGFAVALALATGCGAREKKVVEPSRTEQDIAIWVNGAGITRNDIQWETARLMASMPKTETTDEMQLWVRGFQQAVDNLVVRQLIRSEMAQNPMEISAEEMEGAKKEIEASFGGQQTLSALASSSMVALDTLEESIRMDLFKNRQLADQLARALEEVDEEAARSYYVSHPEEFRTPAGRTASHILIRCRAEASPEECEQARQQAEQVRQRLVEGADFREMAAEYSACLSRHSGGDLGYVRPGLEDPEFEKAVYGQALGEVGPVVRTKVGFHVIQATGEQEAKETSFDESKGWILARLKTSVRRKLAAAYILALREKATIRLAGDLEKAVEASREEVR